MIKGLVSCIIPTYKRSDSLINAVNSVLNQTYSNIEVIVVDDNDKNNVYSILIQKELAKINDSRLYYLQQDKHINGAAARNKGILIAKGEYIAFLDDDDEWNKDKIEKQLMFLNKQDDKYGAVSCLVNIINKGKIIRKTVPYQGGNLHKSILDRTISIYTPTILLKKNALDDSGYFNENLIRHQDIQLFLDFSIKYNIAVLNEHLVNVNIDNTTNAPNVEKLIQIKQNFFRINEKHLNIYTSKEQKKIKAAHNLEIILVAIREHRFIIAIKFILKIGFNFSAYKNLVKRIKKRKIRQ